ncbi:hypothetical protein P3T23_003363 [Paraburkholderia sp. GAS448]|uniref:hypothetical protein n=1 Tax=Paraburkholderia sp. GAS448 TaxID=3035136 RepID=UPI003D19576F
MKAPKPALTDVVHTHEIAGIFNAMWFVQLNDRSVSIESRLNTFYSEYNDTLLTRWRLRLFLYSSVEGLQMAAWRVWRSCCFRFNSTVLVWRAVQPDACDFLAICLMVWPFAKI